MRPDHRPGGVADHTFNGGYMIGALRDKDISAENSALILAHTIA